MRTGTSCSLASCPAITLIVAQARGFREQRFRLSLKPREAYNLEAVLALRPRAGIGGRRRRPSVGAFAGFHASHRDERLADIPLAQRTNLPEAIVTAAPE